MVQFINPYDHTKWFIPSPEQQYHLVYMTTNLLNGKIYVGKHSSYTIIDNYLGGGNLLYKAVKKYGKENFKRIVLFFCLSNNDALDIETRIVNKEFVNRKDTYNIAIGGYGGNMQNLSDEQKIRMADTARKTHTGRIHSEEEKIKRRNSLLISPKAKLYHSNMYGSRNPCARNYNIITPNGTTFIIDCLKEFCRDNNFHYKSFHKHINKGIIKDSHALQYKHFIGYGVFDYSNSNLISNKQNNYKLISPDNTEYSIQNLEPFCKDYNLKYSTMYGYIGKGVIEVRYNDNHICNGWRIDKINIL